MVLFWARSEKALASLLSMSPRLMGWFLASRRHCWTLSSLAIPFAVSASLSWEYTEEQSKLAWFSPTECPCSSTGATHPGFVGESLVYLRPLTFPPSPWPSLTPPSPLLTRPPTFLASPLTLPATGDEKLPARGPPGGDSGVMTLSSLSTMARTEPLPLRGAPSGRLFGITSLGGFGEGVCFWDAASSSCSMVGFEGNGIPGVTWLSAFPGLKGWLPVMCSKVWRKKLSGLEG